MPPAAAPPVTAGDVLTLPELQGLRRVSGVRSAVLVAHAWAAIAGAMALYAIWPSALTLVVAVAAIGARQLGLMVLMHDGVHWRLFSHPKVNNGVAQWLCAYPVWGELAVYRRRHHLHHRHTRQAEDPDLALAPRSPATRTRFWREVVCDLTGITACAHVIGSRPWQESRSRLWRRWRGPIVCNTVLLGALAALGQWHLYPILWLLPLATWYQLVVRLRNVAEHALVTDDDDPLRNTRTVDAGLLARTFVAPYWMNYHLEHHLFVFAPCWKLRAAHAILIAKGFGARMETSPSYLDVVRRATSER